VITHRGAQAPVELAEHISLRDVPLIFMYHNIVEASEDPNLICVTPSRFAEQMNWLESRGLRGVGVGALTDAMRHGRQRGLVGLTFDDGYETVIEAALPELQRRGFGATVFLVSALLGGQNEWDAGPRWPLLSGSGVEQLIRSGIEIGSHGATHMRLAGASAKDLVAEVTDSRLALSSLIGGEIRGFAYPYGSMDGASRAAVREAGYEYACAVETPPDALGSMALPRAYAGQRDTAVRMELKRLFYKPRIAAKGRRS